MVALLVNAAFAVFALSRLVTLPQPLTALATGTVVLVAPGLAWTTVLRRQPDDVVAYGFWVFSLSALIMVVGVTLLHLSGLHVTDRSLGVYVILATNAAFIRGWRQCSRLPRIPWLPTVLVLALFVSLSYASWVMPLISDHDVFFTDTAYGLMHKLRPYCDAESAPFHLMHPVFAHLGSAYAITLRGQLDDTYPSYFRSHFRRMIVHVGDWRDELREQLAEGLPDTFRGAVKLGSMLQQAGRNGEARVRGCRPSVPTRVRA